MSQQDRGLVELFELIEPGVGREAAVKLVEMMPAGGRPLATEEQVRGLEQRMVDRFAAVDARFVSLEQRMDDRFASLEQRMDDRLDGLRNDLLAAFRGELVTAVSGQTRAVVIATATAVFGIGGLAVTLAQVL